MNEKDKTYAEKYCVRKTGKLYIGAFYRKPYADTGAKRNYNYKLEGYYKGYCFLFATGAGRNWREKVHVKHLCMAIQKSKSRRLVQSAIDNDDMVCALRYMPESTRNAGNITKNTEE